jgi:hypothetical protein
MHAPTIASPLKTALTALAVLTAAAQGKPADPQLIAEVCQTIRDNYVFPEVAQRTADHIAARAEAGHYDHLEGRDLAAALTRDLRAFTKDRHFSASALPEGWTPPEERDQERQEPFDPRQHAPYGVQKVERLAGNVGYLDLRGFHPAEHAGDAILSAVRLLQGSSTVILDLRKNGGGDPATVQLLCSYFFDAAEPVHLNSLYFRPADSTTEFWTNAEYPDLVMPETPVYVLTSPYTFSGAEECAYNLQTRKRATIVGETTGGGAHPVDGYAVANTLMLMVPVGRAINPVTNTNWEGTGVAPDVAVPADEALDTALRMALEHIAASGDPAAEWGLFQHAAATRSFALQESALPEFAGNYTDREIALQDGRLVYRRVGAPAWRPLVPVAEDVFMIEGAEDFRMEFERDAEGRITAIRGVYQQGHTDRSGRAG